MTNVAKLGETKRAWIAYGDAVETKDLEALQKQFDGRLTIQHTTKDGRDMVIIYPSCAGDRSDFDAFMALNTSFTEQPVDLSRL